jgi:hypothetical protein
MFRVGVATAVTEPTRSMGLLAEVQKQPASQILSAVGESGGLDFGKKG